MNTFCLKHKIELDASGCPQCHDFPLPPPVPLKIALESIYKEFKPIAIIYLSDLASNLNRIHRHFNEAVLLDNPGCTITLLYPGACDKLLNVYSYLFIDDDITDKEAIIAKVPMTENGKVVLVNPSRQTIIQ